MGGVEQVSPEETAGDQLLGRAEEWGGTVTAGGRDMLRRIPARANAGRRANRLEKQRGNAPGGQNAPQARSFKEKSTCKFHAQQGEAHVLKTGRPAVMAARQQSTQPSNRRRTRRNRRHSGQSGRRELHNKR